MTARVNLLDICEARSSFNWLQFIINYFDKYVHLLLVLKELMYIKYTPYIQSSFD